MRIDYLEALQDVRIDVPEMHPSLVKWLELTTRQINTLNEKLDNICENHDLSEGM